MWEERFDGMDRRFETIDKRFDQVDSRLDELRSHMGVLHEDALGRIAGLSEEPVATKREMDRGFAEMKELLLRRVEPLEAAVRSLSRDRRPERK